MRLIAVALAATSLVTSATVASSSHPVRTSPQSSGAGIGSATGATAAKGAAYVELMAQEENPAGSGLPTSGARMTLVTLSLAKPGLCPKGSLRIPSSPRQAEATIQLGTRRQ